jgi:predicted dehydrogenase
MALHHRWCADQAETVVDRICHIDIVRPPGGFMTTIRVGVIGSGYWGPNMIRNFAEFPNAELVAVADLRPERLLQVQQRYPSVLVTENFRDFFAMNLDAVVIATPPATHYAIGRECLQHGLHTLIEKPITLDSAHAEELIQIAAHRDLTLMVGHTFEYNAAVRELKHLIDSGELGDIYYINAVRVNLGLFNPKMNVLWDLAPHDISIVLYLLNQQSAFVSAQGTSCIFKGVHDIAYLNMRFPDGMLAHIHVSWLDPNKTRRITVVGSKKMVVYDDIEPLEKIKIYDKGVDAPPYTESYGDFQCSYRYGSIVIPHITFTEPLREECKHFLDSITNQTRPLTDGHNGLHVVRVLESADWSLQNKGVEQHVFLTEEEMALAVGGNSPRVLRKAS